MCFVWSDFNSNILYFFKSSFLTPPLQISRGTTNTESVTMTVKANLFPLTPVVMATTFSYTTIPDDNVPDEDVPDQDIPNDNLPDQTFPEATKTTVYTLPRLIYDYLVTTNLQYLVTTCENKDRVRVI